MEPATTTNYRSGLRIKILECAGERFKKHGIRQVRMDDIAHSLGISKRTLYEVYPNKEELLLECIKEHNSRWLEALHNTIGEDWTAMDIICYIYRKRIEQEMSISPLFYDEIKGYPSVKDYLEQMHNQQTDSAQVFFRRGVEEGIFIDICNEDLLRELTSSVNEYIRHNRLYFRYPMAEIFRHCIILFIRSVCTPKGIAQIDRVLEEATIGNKDKQY